MASNKKIVPPVLGGTKKPLGGIIKPTEESDKLRMDFSRFKFSPICIKGKFNNHFKDEQHFYNVAVGFIGTILPKISSHSYSDICEGSLEGRVIHFHTIKDEHREMVREVLEEYNFPKQTIEQILDGNSLFDFSATLGHTYPARIVCHKYENVLEPLFFDTNHHIYINEKYIQESLYYENCPTYLSENCAYAPTECFMVTYLDEEKLNASYGFSYSPQ
ncbi:MAG: hypothetical protein IKL28_10310 [Lachnospiraceae bacterium]|nr:hypothetical protein [Lachnospiraceae bacterium]